MAGEAECQFNTNVWLRGRMVAMTGTFSGTFRADEVDVAQSINIRNGAVSSYIQYTRKKVEGEDQIRYLEWVVPAQPFGTVIDITIPIIVRVNNGVFITDPNQAYAQLFRNGQLIAKEIVRAGANALSISLFASLRFIDFDMPRDAPVTYRVEVQNSGPGGVGVSGRNIRVWMKGKALTGIRKR